MSRSPVRLGVAALLAAGVFGIASCSSDCPNCPGDPAVVVVSPQTISVLPGDTVQVAALVYDADTLHLLTGHTPTWSSSNPGIATVNGSGLVAGIVAGTVTITASAGGVSGSGTAQVVTTSTLAGQVAPILKTTCALAFCHRPNPSGGTYANGDPLPFFDTPANIYAALVTAPVDVLIVAGDTTQGEMLARLKATDATRMPRVAPGDSTPAFAIARRGSYHLIARWIQAGALNN